MIFYTTVIFSILAQAEPGPPVKKPKKILFQFRAHISNKEEKKALANKFENEKKETRSRSI